SNLLGADRAPPLPVGDVAQDGAGHDPQGRRPNLPPNRPPRCRAGWSRREDQLDLPRSGRCQSWRRGAVGWCMADDADAAAAPRDFHYDRWKLAKYAAGSFGFTALSAYLIYRGAAMIYANPGDVLRLLPGLLLAAIGLTTVAFFGMILIVAIS